MKRMNQGYHSAEARAGHDYNISAKHRKMEAEGMRKHEREMHDGNDKKYHQTAKDRRHESEGMDKAYHHHMAHSHHQYMASKHRKAMHKKK